ncbi:MAG: BatA domain-containing protein [Prosthecobacter sp.]|uniref:BatA domain-containing protein n=1 Tax=Prosthecobacter sp. TaxID=1965333 RepID=UPI0025F249EA|nr:BatA domain-containing protein [Prosthecobacter sp.]MCF7784928.1 BatA domain-containing protein [Prosthecobacter sp.]
MNFSLLNPALLAATALIVVPLLAHLFAKAKPREFPFPSLQWLRQVERKTTRLRKPKDWLLLLLRTLIVAALVTAFLQPLLFSGAQLTAANARKTIVLVVDRSASMGFVEQGQSRFVRATAQAEEVLKGAGSQTLANVIWMDAEPEAEFPDPAVNVSALRESLRRAQVTQEPGEVNEAMRSAMEQLGRGEGAKELYVISDFQSTAWKQVDLNIPPNVKLLTIPVATTPATNTALTSLVVQPERPVSGTEARILCRVRNFSGTETKTTVQLAFAEVRQTRALTLPAWGEGVAEFRVPCGAAGLQCITASLPEDAFPADDHRFATVEIRDNWRVAVEGPPQDADFLLWQRALGSLGWLDLKSTAPDPDVRLAVHAAPDRAAELRAAAERGATVICQPGEDWSGSAWMAFWNAGAKDAALQVEQLNRDKDKPWTLQTVQEDHPLWQIFRSGEFGDPAGGNVWRRLKVMPGDAQTLLRYTDGVPALAVQRAGKGWLVLWNIELDEAQSDRVQQPSFLVLLGELLLQYGEAGGNSALRQFIPPQNIFWQPRQPVAADQVRLQDDAGAERPFVYDASQSPAVFRAREALPPGNYKWLLDAQAVERASVNFPADAESDLRTLDPSSLGIGKSLTLSAAAALAAQRDGMPLWPWCVGIALCALVLESLVARSAIRQPSLA